MIRPQRWAGIGRQALTVFADPALFLLGAARFEKISGWAAQIMDVAFEIPVGDQLLRLGQDGGLAAPTDNAAVVEGDRTKMAATIAAAVAVDRKAYLFDCRDAALVLIDRMWLSFVGQGKDPVQLLRRQGLLRRVLDQVPVTVTLD